VSPGAVLVFAVYPRTTRITVPSCVPEFTLVFSQLSLVWVQVFIFFVFFFVILLGFFFRDYRREVLDRELPGPPFL